MILELYQVGEADAKGLEHQAARIRQETQAKARQRYEALAKRAFADRTLRDGWAVGSEGLRVPVPTPTTRCHFCSMALYGGSTLCTQCDEEHGWDCSVCDVHVVSNHRPGDPPLCNACDLARRVADCGEQSNEHATP